MRLALLPGLLLAVALAIFAQGGSTAQAASTPGSNGGTHTLFSVLAQTSPTATLTITATAAAGATGTATGTVTATAGTTATTTLTGTATTAAGTATVAVDSTVTATAEVTSTGAITPTVTPATVPLSGQGGGPNLQLNPFDWNFLTSVPPSGLPGPFAWLFFVLMLGLLGVSAYIYFARRPGWKRTNTPYYKAANRWAPIFMWIAIFGILFWFFRIPSIDFFNLRFWLYLWLLIALGVAAWFVYWYRTAFPKELARFQKTQRAKQYMPGSARPRPATGPSTPVPATGQKPASGKRRKKR